MVKPHSGTGLGLLAGRARHPAHQGGHTGAAEDDEDHACDPYQRMQRLSGLRFHYRSLMSFLTERTPSIERATSTALLISSLLPTKPESWTTFL